MMSMQGSSKSNQNQRINKQFDQILNQLDIKQFLMNSMKSNVQTFQKKLLPKLERKLEQNLINSIQNGHRAFVDELKVGNVIMDIGKLQMNKIGNNYINETIDIMKNSFSMTPVQYIPTPNKIQEKRYDIQNNANQFELQNANYSNCNSISGGPMYNVRFLIKSESEIEDDATRYIHQISDDAIEMKINPVCFQFKKDVEKKLKQENVTEMTEEEFLRKYKQSVSIQKTCMALTTLVETIRIVWKTYKLTNDFKKSVEMGLLQLAKGGVGFLGKYLEIYLTQKQILKLRDPTFRINVIMKTLLMFGVGIGKIWVECIVENRLPTWKQIKETAFHLVLTVCGFFIDYGIRIVLTNVIKRAGFEIGENFVNYSANNIGIVGYNSVNAIGKQLTQLATQRALKSLISSNIVGGISSFFVGTGISVIKGESLEQAIKKNAMQTGVSTTGSLIGGAIGTIICPGFGTAIGSFIGGLSSSIAFSFTQESS